jgi:hypothetical protein
MKQKRFEKKLALNKKTIVNLSQKEMKTIQAGATLTPIEVETWFFSIAWPYTCLCSGNTEPQTCCCE